MDGCERGRWCYRGGPHLPTVIYHRPWRRWFRKQLMIVCWHCDLQIREP